MERNVKIMFVENGRFWFYNIRCQIYATKKRCVTTSLYNGSDYSPWGNSPFTLATFETLILHAAFMIDYHK